MLSSIELQSFVEWSFATEFNEGQTFWFSIISGQESDTDNVTERIEQIFNIALEGLEWKTFDTNLELSFFINFSSNLLWSFDFFIIGFGSF